jgi:hypothetical protein
LAQLKNPCKGDLTITVVITETFEQIARISEEIFRNIVRDDINSLSFTYLVSIKEKEKEKLGQSCAKLRLS